MSTQDSSICVEDFCGSDGVGLVSFSADYYPKDGMTYFSGDWCDVKPMPSAACPTEGEVWAWARQYGKLGL